MPRSGDAFNVVPVVETIIIKDDKVLLSLKKKAKIRTADEEVIKNNVWVLQGGAVEAGEVSVEAAAREAYEEGGVKVDIEKLLKVDEEWSDDVLYITFLYLACPKNDDEPKVIEQDIFGDAKYFSISDLPENIHPAAKEKIQLINK